MRMESQSTGTYLRYSHTIGRGENAGPGFREPVAMARGQGDLMYVLNRGTEWQPEAKRITICTVSEDYLGDFGTGLAVTEELEDLEEMSVPDGYLVWPTSIALDRQGNVYVADEWLNRISIFTKDGEWSGKWGTGGHAAGELDGPSGLAFDQDDSLYIVDSKNNRIQKFTKQGRFILQWGREGPGDGEFNLPWGIDIDRQGNVYVADWRNDRVQKFSSEGHSLMKFGSSGTADGEFNRPTGVAVDGEGFIYVADWGNERLQVFDADGSFAAKVLGDATMSRWGKVKLDANPEMWKERQVAYHLEREKLFWGPMAVEVDSQGSVFVVEHCRWRVQVYEKISPYFLGLYDEARL